jgi:hypothetical protein
MTNTFRFGVGSGPGTATQTGPTTGGGGGGSCEDCPNDDWWGGSYCTSRQRHFINAGDGPYVPSQTWDGGYLGLCTWLECVQDPSSSTGLTCTEYEAQKNWFECTINLKGQWQPFESGTVTLEEVESLGYLRNCFDARWNDERYNRDGERTIRDQIVPRAVSTSFGGGEGDIFFIEELTEANKGCGLGVSSNAHGRIVQCDDAQTMGTLINHWEYGDKSGFEPNAPKTPIKTCLLPRNWTTQDTLDFISDHWSQPLTSNPGDRGPSIFPSRRPEAPGFTFRSTDSNKKLNYAKTDEKYSIQYKIIKTVQNGKQIDICAPVFGLSSEYENLPNCENM